MITFVKNQSLDSDEVQEWNKISVFSWLTDLPLEVERSAAAALDAVVVRVLEVMPLLEEE